MNEIDVHNATRLILDTFGPNVEIVQREAMDVEWAPVERWYLKSSGPRVPESVVIKTRRHGETGWGGEHFNLIAERQALSELAGSGLAPELYASDDDDGVVIMEDFRGSVTVEKLLFADDPHIAASALVSMAGTSGEIGGSTAGISDATWNPASANLIDSTSNLDTVDDLLAKHHFPRMGTDTSIGEQLTSRLHAPSMRALTQWDVMPCNALVVDGRTVIIDFESANPRSMAIDGASYALGFSHYRYWAPLPDPLVVSMIDAWIDGVVRTWERAPTHTEIRRDVAAASVSKTMERLTRLDRIVAQDQSREEMARRRPQIIDSLERTARVCQSVGAFDEISDRMNELATEMRIRWQGTMGSRVFPAFNGGSREGWTIYHPI